MIKRFLRIRNIQERILTYVDNNRQNLALKPAECIGSFESIDRWIRKDRERLGAQIYPGWDALKFREQVRILQGR